MHKVLSRLLSRHLSPRLLTFAASSSSSSSSNDLKRALFRSMGVGDVHAAMRVFRELAVTGDLSSDVLSSLLRLCQETGERRYVGDVVAEARKLPHPDARLMSTLISCLLSFGRLEEAWQEYGSMAARGLRLRSGVVHSLMAAAVRHGRLHSALSLLGELERGQHELQPSLAQELLRATLSRDSDEARAIFMGLVQMYSSRLEPVPEEVVEPLVEWMSKVLGGVKVRRVSISASGVCSGCQQQLSGELTLDHYLLLLEYIESNLEREAASIPTYSEAVDQLQTLLRRHRPFYAVVDGLNMAHQSGHRNIRHLTRVCRQLAEAGEKILVIARLHIGYDLLREGHFGTWRSLKRHYEQMNTQLFFTHNECADDWCFLYACLYSGPRTMFITNDVMGDHAEGMPPHLRRIFYQWQRTRQVRYERKLQFPQPVDTKLQWSGHGWHLPVGRRGSHHWLCMSR